MSPVDPAIVTAWRGYAAALETGDFETIEYAYSAFTHALEHTLEKPHVAVVVEYSEVPGTVEEFAAPLLDNYIREAFENLREAFCILLTLGEDELPRTWEGMEEAFRAWLDEQHARIESGIPDHVKRQWEADRAATDDDEDKEGEE